MSQTQLGACALPFGITKNEMRNKSTRRGSSWGTTGGSTTITAFQTAVPTVVSNAGSTAASIAIANTSRLTRAARVGAITTSSAGTFAEFYGPLEHFIGNAGADGGIQFQAIINVTDAAIVLGSRSLVGVTGTASALTNVETTTLVNTIGFVQLAASGNWQFQVGGTGTATIVDTGLTVDNTSLLDMQFSIEPGANVVYWTIYNMTTDVYYSGYVSTANFPNVNFPAATALMAKKIFRTNNATAAVQGISWSILAADVLL